MDAETALEIARLDGHDQASLVARGDIAPGDLVAAARVRIEVSALNAVSHRAFATGAEEAEGATGPMAGVPWLVKDSLDYPGMPTRSGAHGRTPPVPERAYPFVDAVRATGLCAIGKSTMPEFALSAATEGLVQSPTANPWKSGYSPGGSSGGAAAAVAGALVPFAHASDGGGSIRIPASCCGLIGYKPGRGFNLRARAPHIVEDMIVGDTLLARSARDSVWAARNLRPASAIVAPAPTRPLRIRMIAATPAGVAPDPDVAAGIAVAARLLEAMGHRVEDGAWPAAVAGVVPAFIDMWGYLAREAVASVGDPDGQAIADLVEPWTLGLARQADAPGGAERFFAAMATLPGAVAALFDGCDLVLSPVTAFPPPATGVLGPARPYADLRTAMFDYVAYTPLQNLAGLPAVSLPVHRDTRGLPVGAMLTAPPGGDDVLLDLLAPLEAASGWLARLADAFEPAWTRT